jgi:3-hydroxyisobutyrate dehydrogenase
MSAMAGSSTDARVTVLGTGIMGAAMTHELLRAGLDTTVWDRSRSATASLADAGARLAGSAAEAVTGADVVITMLPDGDAVSAVMFDGPAAALADGAAWAQMGTIGVASTGQVAERLKRLRPGVLFVDAPVSGSKGPAESGQLLILASGPSAAVPVVTPVFEAIGRKTVWLGEAGAGSRMKLAVNAYMSVLVEGLAEALDLVDRLGIDAGKLDEIIEGGPLDAPIADAKLHKMERGDYAPEFPLQWALKDVDLAIEAVGGDAPALLAALSRQWQTAVQAGHGRDDVSAARLALADGGTR